jgi:hypothetical protein
MLMGAPNPAVVNDKPELPPQINIPILAIPNDSTFFSSDDGKIHFVMLVMRY